MEVPLMRQGHSFDAIPVMTSTIRPWPTRFAVLTAALLTLAACAPAATPGTGGTGPAATEGGGGGGAAGGYPDREITMVVPFDAGGPTDTVTRLVAEPMSEVLGQQIVVQNRSGAGGTVGAEEVANAEPDGYTVLMHHIGMSTAPTLYPELAYDPLTDFKTIGLVTEVPMTIVAKPDFEPETLEELVDYVTENAETVTLAHAGVGAASHLCGLLIQNALDVRFNEVPYDGTGPALGALEGNQVDFMCDQTTNTAPRIQQDQVKAYAVTAPERIDVLPDLPTTAEGGLEDVEVTVWHGLYVPAETPDEVVQALTDALQQALADEGVIEELANLGTSPVPEDQATPEAHTQKLEEQIELWRPVIEEAGVTAG
ncbi:MAG TPA: tripartite tricarboxylate transporter substrate-binding protein [Candidatus Limnocylindria bacterium]|nr:tripartite tricarboxylate transporter substrate-binding protein [Candidatus Limnocylindria bacterium]